MIMHEDVSLSRFLIAQERTYEQAFKELRNGKKRSHWMWYIFPQIEGLGSSSISKKFAIKSKAEALAYLKHPVLGYRLVEIAEVLLQLKGMSAEDIFGVVDAAKLKSSMTLFALCAENNNFFERVLNLYFYGELDQNTIAQIKSL